VNKALTIGYREVAEKKFVFIAAGVGAVLPFVLALLPLTRSGTEHSVVALSAAIFAASLAVGLAVSGGSSMIGRELSERRLSFYFTRPVGAAAIWFGKLGAAIFMVLIAPAIVLLPSLLFAGDEWRAYGDGQWPILGLTVVGSIVLLGAAHLLSTFLRSRSALIVIDFVLAVVVAVAIPLLMRPLMQGMAFKTIIALGTLLLIAFVVAVIAGGWWQVADGRTDRRRSHIALSRAFWPILGGALLACAAYVGWIVSPGPADIGRRLATFSAKEGNWMLMYGQAKHRGDYVSGFIYDMDSGKAIRIGGSDLLWGGSVFSRDGNTAVVRRPLGKASWNTSSELIVYPLNGDAKPIETGIVTKERAPRLPYSVSDDGRRLVYQEGPNFNVFDIATKRSLASVRMNIEAPYWLHFVGPDVVRFYNLNSVNGELALTIYELDVKTRNVQQTGELRTKGFSGFLEVTPDGSKMLFRSFVKGGRASEPLIVADARTGARITTVLHEEGMWANGSSILADGTLVAGMMRADRQVTARFIAPGGAVKHEIPLGIAGRVSVIDELPGNRVLVQTAPELPAKGARTVLLIDASNGNILRRTEGIAPWNDQMFDRDPRHGRVGAHRWLPTYTNTTLVAWDPVSGETRHIADRLPDGKSRGELLRGE